MNIIFGSIKQTIRSLATGLSLLLLVWGCTSPEQTETDKPRSPKKQIEGKKVYTGPVEITRRADNRDILLKLNAETASIIYNGDKKFYSSLSKVKGKLYQENQIACELTAEHAIIDRINNILEARGKVNIYSKEKNVIVEAERIVWLSDKQIIQATGNVRATSAEFVVGPYPELFASTNLHDIGTPDQFKSK